MGTLWRRASFINENEAVINGKKAFIDGKNNLSTKSMPLSTVRYTSTKTDTFHTLSSFSQMVIKNLLAIKK